MPNGLSVLMNLAQRPGSSGNIPQHSGDDYELDSMIPEESIYELQDAIGERGAASGRAYAIPSRESLRGSGRSALRRMFGEIGAKGEAASQPHRVAGEYGLEEARIKGAADIQKAQIENESNASLREMMHMQAMERQDALQQQINQRSAGTVAGADRRAAARESGIAARQNAAGYLKLAGEKDKAAAGAWDLFGFGSKRKLQAEAQAARQQAAQIGMSAPIPGDEEELDVSPEEWSAFQSWRQAGGR